MRELIATPSKHHKRCDMLRCEGLSVMEFARTNSTAGRLDLCQDCIDEISRYATVISATYTPPTDEEIKAIVLEKYGILLGKFPVEQNVPPEIVPPAPPQTDLFACKYGCGYTHTKQRGINMHEMSCKLKPVE